MGTRSTSLFTRQHRSWNSVCIMVLYELGDQFSLATAPDSATFRDHVCMSAANRNFCTQVAQNKWESNRHT